MTIKIPVEAQFDAADVEQQLQQFQQKLNALGQQIAQANKTKFRPVDRSSLEDLRKVTQQFEALKRVSGDLNRRINATGQKGSGFLDLDWSKLYPDQHVRQRQMAKAFGYVTGHAMPPPAGGGGSGDDGGRPGRRPRDSDKHASWGNVAAGAARAGLNAASGVTGGVGGVASNAIGTGMSAGFGAGLMGLLGGMVALGVGKLVGAFTEKLEQAERDKIAYDTLKRTLGDVNVSFGGLQTVIESAANNVRITFDEAARLGTQFAKLGNLTAKQYESVGAEVQTGVGLSRAFGLDPSQGVGFLGTLRGAGQTRNEQDSRKMALLVGETIAKSDAFAKSDEVMDALASFVTQQTRTSLGRAPVDAFAGQYAALTGSGIPGMTPANSAAILSRVMQTLSAGGGKGEASQFFSGRIAERNGLNPIAGAVWRQNPMAGVGEAFAPDSAVGRYLSQNGVALPSGGGGSFYAQTLDQLKADYTDPWMRLNAASNHLGVNESQAAALLATPTQQMGQLEGYLKAQGIKLSDLNAGGIATLGKLLTGDASDRVAIASGLRGRAGKDALTDDEVRRLDKVMATGTADEQKAVLAALVAVRDQEQTQGKDIRDSKNAVENIKTMMAETLLPVTQAMRDGIMYMAGGKDGMSAQTIREKMAETEVNERYGRLIDEQKNKIKAARSPDFARKDPNDPDSPHLTGTAYAERMAESRRIQIDASKRISALEEEQEQAVKDRLKKLREAVKKADELEQKIESQQSGGNVIPFPGVSPSPSGRGRPLGVSPINFTTGDGHGSADTFIDAAAGRLPRGFRNNNPGNLVDDVQWHGMVGSDGKFAKFATPHEGYRAMGKNLLTYQSKHGLNTVRGIISRWAPAGENNTASYIAKVSKEMGVNPDDPLDLREQQTLQKMITSITRHENGRLLHGQDVIGAGAAAALGQGTPMPADAASARDRQQRFIFDAAPIEIIHKNESGQHIQPPQRLATRIRPVSPFGLMEAG